MQCAVHGYVLYTLPSRGRMLNGRALHRSGRRCVRGIRSSISTNTPPPGFDTRKVKGLVATLLALKPEDHGKSTALEIAAGGKLYNVVMEDERMGKDLLERGGIKKRVTLIPLNKIRAFKLSAEVRHT